jgi:hypothetical protein
MFPALRSQAWINTTTTLNRLTMDSTLYVRGERSLYMHPSTPLSMESRTKLSPSDSKDSLKGGSLDKQPIAEDAEDTKIDFIERRVGLDNDKRQRGANQKQKTELMLSGSEENISTLQDLSNLLYTRGRLQELGCTFTLRGELLTYGYPASLQEFEQLLRLGPIYDEQWIALFTETPPSHVETALWSDLRTLKRVLSNEGVTFERDHQRLTYGNLGDKMLRLCAAYDDLWKLWNASMEPSKTTSMAPIIEQNEDECGENNGCLTDNEGDQAKHDQKEPSHDPNTMVNVDLSQESLPRNIGWRFSTDLDRAAADNTSVSSQDDFWKQLARELEVARTVRLPTALTSRLSAETLRSPPATPRTSAGSFFRPLMPARRRTAPVPSPLQVRCSFSPSRNGSAERLTLVEPVEDIDTIGLASTTTPVEDTDMIGLALTTQHRRNLTLDTFTSGGETVVARGSTVDVKDAGDADVVVDTGKGVDTNETAEAKETKKKLLKKWWLALLDRMTPPPEAAVGQIGGWW